MSWTKLLASKEAQRHKTCGKELDNIRALIARDLADAAIAGLSADRRFATAHNAALQAANMAIACAGYRILSKANDGLRASRPRRAQVHAAPGCQAEGPGQRLMTGAGTTVVVS